MKRIASFQTNRDMLKPGMYTARIDDDIITYDICVSYPNSGKYPDNDELHSFEHLFTAYARNSEYSDSIVHIGPMGSRTGFYFLVRETITPEMEIKIVKEALKFIASYNGEIPCSKPSECGNAAEHSLAKAKKLAAQMGKVLENWTVKQLNYEG